MFFCSGRRFPAENKKNAWFVLCILFFSIPFKDQFSKTLQISLQKHLEISQNTMGSFNDLILKRILITKKINARTTKWEGESWKVIIEMEKKKKIKGRG